jgi:Protein of unknown function (DUF4236)
MKRRCALVGTGLSAMPAPCIIRARYSPGVRVNLSRSGPSLTFGVPCAHVTVGSRGVRRTVGIPGTGAFYTDTTGRHTGVHSSHRHATD